MFCPAQVVVSSSQAPDPEEEALYASPEELLSNGIRATPKSDVYSLGMLFFELFNPSMDSVDRKRALEALRHRILPSHVLEVSSPAFSDLMCVRIRLLMICFCWACSCSSFPNLHGRKESGRGNPASDSESICLLHILFSSHNDLFCITPW